MTKPIAHRRQDARIAKTTRMLLGRYKLWMTFRAQDIYDLGFDVLTVLRIKFTRSPRPPACYPHAALDLRRKKMERLQSRDIVSQISHAATITPEIGRSELHRKVILPPFFHYRAPAALAGREVRRSLKHSSYDTVVCVSFLTTDADLRAVARSVSKLPDAGAVLVVVISGRSVIEGGALGFDVFHLAPCIRSLRRDLQLSVLLDLIRGVNPSTVISLPGGGLMRSLIKRYGRQLGLELESSVSGARIFKAAPHKQRDAAHSGAPSVPKAEIIHDISAVLNVHAEGATAAPAVRSFLHCIAKAEQTGLRIQKILVLDRPSLQTREFLSDFGLDGCVLLETDFGDQGLSRNYAVGKAAGNALAFLDGDDLWGEDWLGAAWASYREYGPKTILHPEYSIFFGRSNDVLVALDQTEPTFDLEFFRFGNYYDALCLADRNAHISLPYARRNIENGYAYEDWNWHCRTAEAGYVHRVVPNTVHFKRRRAWSQNIEANQRRAVVRPTPLFSYSWYR